MKKTLSIHLGRQLFVIEEDAYDRLQAYIKKLEASLSNESGVSDIIEDIEMRFAELLQNYLGETRKVVTIADIEKGISSLGEPEEISEESQQEYTNNQQSNKKTTSEKRLYRDTDNSTIAGICSGLAAYLNLDPVIVRIIFVLFGFMGFGVGLYIILWIVVPNAKTPTERLQMRGKAVTVDTIKEEIEKAANRIKSDSLKAADRFKNSSDHISSRARDIVRLIGKLVGLGLIVSSLIWLTAFSLLISGVIDFIPTTGDQNYASLYEFLQLVNPVTSNFQIMWWSILLLGFAGPFLAIVIGSRLLLGKATRFFTINFIIFPLLIGVGIVFAIITGIQTSRDFAVYAEVENQHISGKFDALYVDELPHYTNNQRIVSTGGLDFINIEKGYIQEHGIHIKYRPSKDTLFHVFQVVSAHGIDRTAALKRSNHIHHQLKFEGQKVWIDPYYSFNSKDGLRDQEVEIIIEVPKGKSLYINNIQQHYLDQEQNGEFFSNTPFEPWED